MARRALLERSDQLTADDEALPPRQPHSARPDQVDAALAWRRRQVAGLGRARNRLGGAPADRLPRRARDHRADRTRQTGGEPSARQAQTTQFPVTTAEAYALEFGHVYLNFSPASAAARSADLASFLPPGY